MYGRHSLFSPFFKYITFFPLVTLRSICSFGVILLMEASLIFKTRLLIEYLLGKIDHLLEFPHFFFDGKYFSQFSQIIQLIFIPLLILLLFKLLFFLHCHFGQFPLLSFLYKFLFLIDLLLFAFYRNI